MGNLLNCRCRVRACRYAGLGATSLFRTEEFYIGQIQRLSGSFEYPNTAAAYFAMSLPFVWWSSFRPAVKMISCIRHLVCNRTDLFKGSSRRGGHRPAGQAQIISIGSRNWSRRIRCPASRTAISLGTIPRPRPESRRRRIHRSMEPSRSTTGDIRSSTVTHSEHRHNEVACSGMANCCDWYSLVESGNAEISPDNPDDYEITA